MFLAAIRFQFYYFFGLVWLAYCCCSSECLWNLSVLDIYVCMNVTVCCVIFSVFRKQPAIYDVYTYWQVNATKTSMNLNDCARSLARSPIRTHTTNHLKRLMNMHELFTLLICHQISFTLAPPLCLLSRTQCFLTAWLADWLAGHQTNVCDMIVFSIWYLANVCESVYVNAKIHLWWK